MMNRRAVKLENVFTGDIVFCLDLKETRDIDGISFIKVFEEEKKDRFFLVNRSAFKILNK